MAKQILSDVAPYKLRHKFGYAKCDKDGKKIWFLSEFIWKFRHKIYRFLSADITDSNQCLSVRKGLGDAMLNDEGSESYKSWLSKWVPIIYSKQSIAISDPETGI